MLPVPRFFTDVLPFEVARGARIAVVVDGPRDIAELLEEIPHLVGSAASTTYRTNGAEQIKHASGGELRFFRSDRPARGQSYTVLVLLAAGVSTAVLLDRFRHLVDVEPGSYTVLCP